MITDTTIRMLINGESAADRMHPSETHENFITRALSELLDSKISLQKQKKQLKRQLQTTPNLLEALLQHEARLSDLPSASRTPEQRLDELEGWISTERGRLKSICKHCGAEPEQVHTLDCPTRPENKSAMVAALELCRERLTNLPSPFRTPEERLDELEGLIHDELIPALERALEEVKS